MTSSKDAILARIRAANGTAKDGTAKDGAGAVGDGADGRLERAEAAADAAYAALSRDYLRAHHDPAAGGVAGLFAERAADYRAVVEQVPEPGLATAIAKILAERAAAAAPGSFVVPDGLPPGWLDRTAPGPRAGPRRRRRSRRPN